MFNKFSSDLEPLTQLCIYRWIEYKAECGVEFNTKLYEDLPFITKNRASKNTIFNLFNM